MRRDIDRKPHKIKRVLTDARIREAFFGGVAENEKMVVQAFVGQNAENARQMIKPAGILPKAIGCCFFEFGG